MKIVKKYKNPDGPLKWPGLRSVNFKVYPDENFQDNEGYISTIAPNQIKALFDNISDYEANRISNRNITGKYVNELGHLVNPVFWQNSIIYNPKYINNDALALEALHIMHEDPIYEELFNDYVQQAIDNDAILQSAYDEFDSYGKDVIRKYHNGLPLSVPEYSIIDPIFDALLRRQFAPSYMATSKRGGYQPPLKLKGALGKRVQAIRDYLESIPLPEVIVNK